MGLSDSQLVMRTNIPELAECREAALDLVDQGCDVIFAGSFGHEQWMLEAAKAEGSENVEFCHATGTTAHTANQDNFHNAFASIYEGRYLAGIAAGHGTQSDDRGRRNYRLRGQDGLCRCLYLCGSDFRLYVFLPGLPSPVCPTVTMEVQFTGSWYDVTAERTAAESLISRGCILISQHADSMGAPTACEEAGVPNVSYNGSTIEACPETFIVSSRIDWTPYFKYIIAQTIRGEEIADDWTGTIATGSVVLTDLNSNTATQETVDAIVAARTQLANGT